MSIGMIVVLVAVVLLVVYLVRAKLKDLWRSAGCRKAPPCVSRVA
jgi:Flp pilus assembly pilin Flp